MASKLQMKERDRDPEAPDDSRGEVAELLERRDAIQTWLDRLESQRPTASGKVLERVRADYEGRLRETLEALRAHREAVEGELVDAEARLQEAALSRAEAGDSLEEGHLRHRIGELPDDEWDRRRTALEETAEHAHRLELQTEAEVRRLRELLEQLGARPAAPAADPTPQPEPLYERPEEPTSGSVNALDSDIRLESGTSDLPEPWALDPPDVTLEAGSASQQADAFLADLDRALQDENEPASAGDPPDGEDPETLPKPGLKCPECGYTNDISAWFCGVCGADIG